MSERVQNQNSLKRERKSLRTVLKERERAAEQSFLLFFPGLVVVYPVLGGWYIPGCIGRDAHPVVYASLAPLGTCTSPAPAVHARLDHPTVTFFMRVMCRFYGSPDLLSVFISGSEKRHLRDKTPRKAQKHLF